MSSVLHFCGKLIKCQSLILEAVLTLIFIYQKWISLNCFFNIITLYVTSNKFLITYEENTEIQHLSSRIGIILHFWHQHFSHSWLLLHKINYFRYNWNQDRLSPFFFLLFLLRLVNLVWNTGWTLQITVKKLVIFSWHAKHFLC